MTHIFHVHTFRCKHASDELDDDYIKTALSLEAERITFTEHCPFPGNPFRKRMDLDQLPEYIETLKSLRDKYQNQIKIEIGLEVEYIPSMLSFYESLDRMELEPLILGQHFYQHPDGTYSFDDDKEYNKKNEYIGCSTAMIDGIKSGLFKVVAHPDRIFRRCKAWTPEMEAISKELISTAAQNDVMLEKNLSSFEKYLNKSNFIFWRKEFWDLVDSFNQTAPKPVKTIVGFDAHSTENMIQRAEILENNKDILYPFISRNDSEGSSSH